MVKIESRVGVGSERIRSRSTNGPMTGTMDTGVDEVGLGLKSESERTVVGLRLDEGLLLGREPAGAELDEEVAGEAARGRVDVVVHGDVELPVGERSVLDTVGDVTLLLSLPFGDNTVATKAVNGVPDFGPGVVGGIAAVVPVTVESVRKSRRMKEDDAYGRVPV